MNYMGFLVPLAAGVLVVLIISAIFAFVRTCRLNVPPNKVAVISGRGSGVRKVHGGGTFVIPIFERKDELDLSAINIENLEVKGAITKEGVPLTVKAVANVKIGSEEALLNNAVERLLGKTQSEIRQLAYETLEGHLRSMLGTLSVEEINNDRSAFQVRMISESQEDLAKLGLKIDVLTIKEISDTQGYLDAMGKTRIAERKRDAEIGAANAMMQATIQSTTAERQGQVTEQDNLAQQAEAEKRKNVRIQQYLAETNAEQARAQQAGPLATAQAQKDVVEAEQMVQLAKTQKATEVARAEQERKQQELIATQIRPAEAARDAEIAKAEGDARAISIRAAADRERLIAEGQGRAEATRLNLFAEADGIERKLLAEATGLLKKAEAYERLDTAGRLLQVLEAAQTLGPNIVKEFAGVMGAAAAPLQAADKIVLIDSGGSGNGAGHLGSVERFGSAAPNLVFAMVEKLSALGIDVSKLLASGGVTAENGDTPTKVKA